MEPEREIVYTHNTLLTSGKYKYTSLCRVSADWLLSLHGNKSYHDKALIAYIAKNLDYIIGRKKGTIVTPQLKFECDKIPFLDERAAKDEIKRIQELDQVQKKPVRSYECPKCNWWHTTSIPIEEWKKIVSQTKGKIK